MLDKIDYQLEHEAKCPYCGEYVEDPYLAGIEEKDIR